MNDDRLSPDEREAFEALPRERATPRALEERVVSALRREGLVREPREARALWWGWRFSFAPALAAGILLFAGGIVVGARFAPAGSDGGAAVTADALDRAQRIERSGSDYVQALAALGRGADTARSDERDRAHASATRILRQAAQEVARLDPDDPIAERILGSEMASAALASNEGTHIVWY